jgi:DDE_Tnp_1-associated
MASPRSRLDEIVASFSTMEDPRSHINRRHPRPSVLVIAVLAVLAGAAGPTAIAQWAECKAELLVGLLDLPNGVPGKDVFRRVLMMINPEAFGDAFNAWIAHLRGEAAAETGVERPIIAVDGKTARRMATTTTTRDPLVRPLTGARIETFPNRRRPSDCEPRQEAPILVVGEGDPSGTRYGINRAGAVRPPPSTGDRDGSTRPRRPAG